MRLNYEKVIQFIFFLIIAIEAVFLGFIWFHTHQDISFENEPLTQLNTEWITHDSEGSPVSINLPITLESQEQYIRISHKLPDSLSPNCAITTLSSGTSMNVSINGALIYSINDETKFPFRLAPGSMWNVITIPEDAAGKMLTIEITPEPKHTKGTVNEVYFGSKSAFLLHIIESRGLNLFIAFIILLISIVLLVLYLFMLRFLKNNNSILYLGLFSLCISIWMLMESDIMQFFLDNRYFITTLKYLSLMTLPIPVIFFLSLIDHYRYKNQTLLLNSFFVANAAVMLVLQFMDIINFHDGLIVLHGLMMIIFTILIILLCMDVVIHKNKNLRYIALSFGILFVFSMLEIISYNLNPGSNAGSFLQFGVLFFLIVMSANSLRKAIEIMRLGENAKQYEYLATRDYMTKCKNRNSYIKELDQILHDRRITILLADINNTKYINDTYGHHAGDFIIVQCSRCLLEIFGESDCCYRIGGDEFVCVEFSQNEETIQEKIKIFFKLCEEVNSDCPYPFEVSIGYAFFDKTQDHDIYDTVKRADKDMYHRKNKMKYSSIQ